MIGICEGYPGVVIAAPKSGSGKTTLTCAFLQALLDRGMNVCAFKCGPDYIDPMFHRKVINIVSRNMDSYFSDAEQLRENFAAGSSGYDFAVVEGVMGLFDGISGVSDKGSTYEVASVLKLPIILVVDGHGCGRSLIPLIAGFLKYDTQGLIRGVILNNTSQSFYEKIAPVITKELSVPILGFMPRRKDIAVDSRHLGLHLPGEVVGLKEKLHAAAKVFEQNVCIDGIIEKSRSSGTLPKKPSAPEKTIDKADKKVKIGVARDEAFCFYYEENLELLEKLGAELVPFSPVHDNELPDGLDGLLLGGGYPENYAKELEDNASMRRSIALAIKSGMPSLAECGGFMYLHETIEDKEGNVRAMCGVIPGKCRYTGKLVRFGYVEITEKVDGFLKSGVPIKGHEFHYYDSDSNGSDCVARKPFGSAEWECISSSEDHFWGFPHLYYPSCPEFAVSFIRRLER